MTATTRRNFLATLVAAVPMLAALPARAWTPVAGADVGVVPASGLWSTLEHVTDGTDPSPAVVAPPRFTDAMRKLAGTEITLTGFVQPVATGFGARKDYLLSRNTFHCPYCYAFGRGSLVLASIDGHVPAGDRKVTVRGVLALQETDPGDFYFQLKNARVV